MAVNLELASSGGNRVASAGANTPSPGDETLWLLIIVALVWGFTAGTDSAQFSTIVTEVVDQRYVGSAVTLQLAVGFMLTVVTIWLIPVLRTDFGWGWAFGVLVPGPILGLAAMVQLRTLPEARAIASGRG